MSKLQNDKVSFELDLRATKAQEEIHRLTKATEELRRQNAAHRKEISRLAATEGDHSAEIKQLNDQIKANTREIAKNKDAIELETKKIDLSRKSAADLRKELRNLQKQQSHLSRALDPEKWRELEKEINRYKEALEQAESPTVTIGDRLRKVINIGEITKGVFMSIGNQILETTIRAFSKLTNIVMDFERENSRLAAILGTNADGIGRLTNQAKELGRTTSATASEVTQLQIELAKLGFTQEQIEEMTPAVLTFSRAVNTDLASAAAFAGASLRIFDRDASRMDETLASLAISTNRSALDFSKLETAMSTVGPVANAAGFGLEDTTAILGILANAGFDASSAATATRNIILKLVDSSSELAQGLGRPVKNLEDLAELFVKLEAEGVDLNKALEMTDKRSVSVFATMMKQPQQLMALKESITGVTAEFNNMAATMVDNATGASLNFESAVEGLILRFSSLTEGIKWLYMAGTEVINWIASIIDALSPLGEIIGAIVASLGYVITAVGNLIGLFTGLFTQSKVGRIILNALVVALIAFKTETILTSEAIKSFIAGMVAKTSTIIKARIATISATIATKGWTKALLANPFTLVATLLAGLISYIIEYNSTTGEAQEATDDWTECSKNVSKSYGEQKGKIQALIMVAENEKVSMERRLKAIKDLNKIIPGYNAQIDATTKKMTASKAALDAYLASMEKEMKYKAYSEKMQELISARLETSESLRALQRQAAKRKLTKDERKEIDKLYKELEDIDQRMEDFKASFKKELESGSILPDVEDNNPITTISDDLNETSKEAKNLINRLKEINSELKSLRSSEPKSDEDFRRIQDRIKALKDEKQQILENNEVRSNSNVRQDEAVLQATFSIDETHQRNMFDLNKRRQNISDTDYTMEKARETIRYCEELQAALDKLRANTDSTHTATLNAIAKREAEISTEIAAANQAIDKTSVQQRAQLHKDLMRSYEAASETEIKAIEEKTSKRIISEETAEMYILNRTRQLHQDQLEELRSYLSDVRNAEDMSYDEKQAEIDRVVALIKTTQNKILTGTGQLQEKLRLLMTDSTSLQGIKNAFDLQLQSIESTYAVAIAVVGEGTEEAIALEAEKQRRIAALNYQYQEQMWQIQEQIGLSWADEYDRELASLKNMHDQGLLDEVNYQKARLKIGEDSAKKYFDFYAGLSGSMFSAIQDAEIAMSEAKYDVLIQQAKNNGDDTSALEEEKENKKLEIQKKYADVNFAIKVSQIIADTAVSIMKAYADLGPIAGSIAAALLTATGAAQLVQAKAERDKIKNMQPGNTAGSSKKEPASAQRVLSGYSDGGYTGDGDRYEVAGVVHRGEYVVPKPIMNNPRVVDAVGTIEAIRRHKILSMGHHSTTPPAGYADGGYTSAPPVTNTDYIDKMEAAIKEFKIAVKNIRAYVVLQDLERAQESLQRSRAPFTRQ